MKYNFFKICCQDLKNCVHYLSIKIISNEKVELQSWRSRRNLQFSYKGYLHPNSQNKLQYFKDLLVPTAVWNDGRECYNVYRLVGALPPFETVVGPLPPTLPRFQMTVGIVLQNIKMSICFCKFVKNKYKIKNFLYLHLGIQHVFGPS
jgi:hypothetical protein